MISTNKLKQTNAYKNLDAVQQKTYLNKNTVRDIELGVNMSNLKGFDFWVKTCSPKRFIKAIVEELLKTKTP